MTDLTTKLHPKSPPVASPASIPAPTAAEPALITEEQVLFSTAAAVALPPAKTRRFSDVVQAVAAAIRGAFAASEKPRKHYPRRHAYLENALMAREMHRL